MGLPAMVAPRSSSVPALRHGFAPSKPTEWLRHGNLALRASACNGGYCTYILPRPLHLPAACPATSLPPPDSTIFFYEYLPSATTEENTLGTIGRSQG